LYTEAYLCRRWPFDTLASSLVNQHKKNKGGGGRGVGGGGWRRERARVEQTYCSCSLWVHVVVVWRCCIALSYLPSCCSIELRNKTNKRPNRKHMHINCPYRIILMKKSLFPLFLRCGYFRYRETIFNVNRNRFASKLNDLNNLKSRRRQTKEPIRQRVIPDPKHWTPSKRQCCNKSSTTDR